MTTTPHPRIKLSLVCAAAFGCFAAPMPALADTIVKPLAPGVSLTQEVDGDIPLVIDVVTVDLTAPGVKAAVGIAQDHIGGTDPTLGREDVSRYARRHHALVAVNGDFFPYTGDPLGIGIHNGELFSEPWTGNGKGGPREVLGILSAEQRAVIDKLGFHGVLYPPTPASISTDASATQPAADTPTPTPPSPAITSTPQPLTVHGVDRVVGKDEIVAITPLYHGAKVNRPGGTDVVLTGVNLPVQANKLMQGKILAIRTTADGIDAVPVDGVILAGGPGKGGAALTAALRPGDDVQFVMSVGDTTDPAAGIQVAELPTTGELPSRSGAGVDRTAWTWSHIDEALGGGPRLLTAGNVDIDGAADGFDPGFINFPNPRTAVGLADDGKKLIIVTVDGRQSISRGVSLDDLAGILKRYGAVDAMNLDGGGSTVMAVGGLIVDSPGGAGSERPVADMLVITSDSPSIDIPDWDPAGRAPDAAFSGPPALRLSADKGTIQEGQTTEIVLRDGDRPVDSAQVIWEGPVRRAAPPVVPSAAAPSTTAGAKVADDGPIGFVDQRGNFTALRAGTGVVTALYQGHLLTAIVDVTPKPAGVDVAVIRAAVTPDPHAPSRADLSIHVALPGGAPVANAELDVSVSGGTADNHTVTTDADGLANVGITWSGNSGGVVTVGPSAAPGANPGLPTMLSVTLGQR